MPFSGHDIYPGKGIRFIHSGSQVFPLEILVVIFIKNWKFILNFAVSSPGDHPLMQTKSLSHLYLCFDYIKYSIPLIFTFCVVSLSLAYLLILHFWDEYRRGAKGNVGAQISTRSDCPDSELHQLSSR